MFTNKLKIFFLTLHLFLWVWKNWKDNAYHGGWNDTFGIRVRIFCKPRWCGKGHRFKQNGSLALAAASHSGLATKQRNYFHRAQCRFGRHGLQRYADDYWSSRCCQRKLGKVTIFSLEFFTWSTAQWKHWYRVLKLASCKSQDVQSVFFTLTLRNWMYRNFQVLRVFEGFPDAKVGPGIGWFLCGKTQRDPRKSPSFRKVFQALGGNHSNSWAWWKVTDIYFTLFSSAIPHFSFISRCDLAIGKFCLSFRNMNSSTSTCKIRWRESCRA